MKGFLRSKLILTLATFLMIAAAAAIPLAGSIGRSHAAAPHAAASNLPTSGNLDCNGYSPLQPPTRPYICADTSSKDNGYYIGHDEPSVQFLSNHSGSGNNVEWEIILPKEKPLPATQTFENQVTFWFSMALCDPNSFPFNPCTPDSDKNPPAHFQGDTTTAGSAILELQFYPPGSAFFSCSTTTWCAAMTIDSFENNPNCNEPINFQYIQTDGVPVGGTPNAKTLQMGQGDRVEITLSDTTGGLLNQINDNTTSTSGSIVASAANGFFDTNHTTCATTPFSYHPEFSTAKFGNFVPWATLQANVGFASEIGHFELADKDADDSECVTGPVVAGCYDLSSGGDLDFDGTSYQADWPDGTKTTPTPVTISSDLGNGIGPVSAPFGQDQSYSALMFETPILGTELATGTCCHIPPSGATFYPFYAQSGFGTHCVLTIGNDIRGATVNDFGRGAQFGSQNLAWSAAQSSGGIRPNPCIPRGGEI